MTALVIVLTSRPTCRGVWPENVASPNVGRALPAFLALYDLCGGQSPPYSKAMSEGATRDGHTPCRATEYEVGEGRPYPTIGMVPWESLQPGDTVLIHWRPAPYREKWVVGRSGTTDAPITVRGVPGPDGQLPVIDGENAVTRPQLDYWNENRSVVKVGGSSTPADSIPEYVVIENLDVRGARPPNTFTDDHDTVQAYANNAASIHVERGAHIVIRGCVIRDSGNGLFISSSDAHATRDVLIQGNHIYGNGNVGRMYEHNVYTAAIGIIYQYNRFGPPVDGALGSNLKDRSAGLVVRYNWIEGGNRQLDLVDAEDSTLIRSDPSYRETFVYGNILIEPPGAGNKQIVHYGGDSSTTSWYRKGDLHFYHNTVVSTRTDGTTLFRLSTTDEHADARDNVFYVSAAGNALAMLDGAGVLDLSHNWQKPGWVLSFGILSGTVNDDGTSVEGNSPGFVDDATQDYELIAGSPTIDAAADLAPPVLPDFDVNLQYVRHTSGKNRRIVGVAADLGAFEWQPPFDHDGDGGVALDDYGVLANCLFGPGVVPAPASPLTPPECLDVFDTDAGNDVDLLDFAKFQIAFTK